MAELEEAVRRVARGETAAFAEIVEATSGRLVRMSARMLGSVADAEDVVQDAYVKAYRALTSGGFDGRARVTTWLYRITMNTALDALRTRRRAIDYAMDEAAFQGPDAADSRLALRELADWLDALPVDQRAAVTLKMIEGFSSAETAEILGCTEGAVEQRLVRARVKLRERGDG